MATYTGTAHAALPMTPALAVTAAWTMGGVVLFVVAPQTAFALPILCVVAPVGWYWAEKHRMLWHRPSAVFVSLYLATAYLALNATWSLDPTRAAVVVLMLLAFVSSVDVALTALQKNDSRVIYSMSIGFLAGIIVGGAYLCFEIFSGQWARRAFMSWQSWARPDARYLRWSANGMVLLPDLLNRSMAALTMLFWPALLVIDGLRIERRRRIQLLTALVPAVAAILWSAQETSKMALFGSAAVYGLCLVRPLLARRTAILGWVAATLLVVPLATVLFSQKLHTARWLFPSAQHRIVIWGYTSEQVAKAPILGAGINAARVLDERDRSRSSGAPGTEFRLGTGWHSHNIYLQTWYETGAIGVAFLLVIGLLVIRSIATAPTTAQAPLYATFASCSLVGATSFSFWALWFMASFGLAAIFAGLGLETIRRGE